MPYDRVVISSGHGKHVRGACGILDEVDEARRVVERLAEHLESCDVDVEVFHDNTSQTQSENLDTIVRAHNSCERELDISVHFNAYEQVDRPMGVEVLYVTQDKLAGQVSSAIAACGFINRGPKKRTDLAFLNGTDGPAILIEVCFVDSEADAEIYEKNFNEICEAIAEVIGGEESEIAPPPPDCLVGTCSFFGGPDDTGVAADEGLAFIYAIDEENQYLFLPFQPPETSGLARRLNPAVHYCAMRFDYEEHPKSTLLQKVVLVRNPRTGFALTCTPADWGPHGATDRLIDLSPSMMLDLDLETDDEVEVIFPYEAR